MNRIGDKAFAHFEEAVRRVYAANGPSEMSFSRNKVGQTYRIEFPSLIFRPNGEESPLDPDKLKFRASEVIATLQQMKAEAAKAGGQSMTV